MKPSPGPVQPIDLPDGRSLPVSVRRSERARRVALRLSPSGEAVELVVPLRTSLVTAYGFLESRRGWVAAQAMRVPPRVPFADGAVIPYLGLPHCLTAVGAGAGRRSFWIGEGRIEVTGAPEHLARRTRDGLRERARRLLAEKTAATAARLGRRIAGVAIGDASSRWGSCAASGRIRYSWRLILAPERVVDYVVAHEVAHLAEMNHSHRFWRVVESLHAAWREDRTWLSRHGRQLQRYG